MQIAQGRSEIAAVLAAAGHLEESEVSAAAGQIVAAGSLKEAAAWKSWFSKLSNILYGFYRYYIELNLASLSYIRDYVCDSDTQIETEAERQEAIAATIADAIRLLSELSGECPEIGCGMSEYQLMECAADHEIEAGMLADWVERVSWSDELFNIIDIFQTWYRRLHLQPLDCLEDIETEEARHEAITALIGELQELLMDNASHSPGPQEVSAAADPEVYEEGQHIEAAIELRVSLTVAEQGMSLR